MIELQYGVWNNGVEQIIETRYFRPIEFKRYSKVETSEFRDVRGELIRNVLYTTDVVELVIGTDEYYISKSFLEAFFAASLQKIYLDGGYKYCKTIEKGALPVDAKEERREVKIILEVV